LPTTNPFNAFKKHSFILTISMHASLAGTKMSTVNK